MKFPQQHITKLTLATTKYIVMGVVFTISVMTGILNIIATKFTESKVDAKTRITSDQSKIVPKNTRETRSDFGHPYLRDKNGNPIGKDKAV